MTKICIVVILGAPGAGKTTLCKYLVSDFKKQNINAVHVMYDDYELKVENNCYKNERQKCLQTVEEILKKIEKNCDDIWAIFIDDIMYYRSMRHEYFNLTKIHGIAFSQIYVKCNINTIMKRNNSRTINKIPEHVIHNIFNKLEEPSQKHWEHYSCIINSENPYNENTSNICKEIILHAVEHPYIENEVVVTNNSESSLIQKIDIILRKAINKKLQSVKNECSIDIVKSISQTLCVKKSEILNLLRKRQLFITEDISESFVEQLLDFSSLPL